MASTRKVRTPSPRLTPAVRAELGLDIPDAIIFGRTNFKIPASALVEPPYPVDKGMDRSLRPRGTDQIYKVGLCYF